MHIPSSFEWDDEKDKFNQDKHGVSFATAKLAFFDPCKVLIKDSEHSTNEDRWYCLGEVEQEILTVRFTYRNETIRIIGAGYWRKGKKRYEEENQIH